MPTARIDNSRIVYTIAWQRNAARNAFGQRLPWPIGQRNAGKQQNIAARAFGVDPGAVEFAATGVVAAQRERKLLPRMHNLRRLPLGSSARRPPRRPP